MSNTYTALHAFTRSTDLSVILSSFAALPLVSDRLGQRLHLIRRHHVELLAHVYPVRLAQDPRVAVRTTPLHIVQRVLLGLGDGRAFQPRGMFSSPFRAAFRAHVVAATARTGDHFDAVGDFGLEGGWNAAEQEGIAEGHVGAEDADFELDDCPEEGAVVGDLGLSVYSSSEVRWVLHETSLPIMPAVKARVYAVATQTLYFNQSYSDWIGEVSYSPPIMKAKINDTRFVMEV